MKDKRKILLLTGFALYSLILIYFLFFNGRCNARGFSYSDYIKYSTNFIPFRYIKSYASQLLKGYIIKENVVNLIGNIAIFVPLGAMLPAVFDKLYSFRKFLLLSLIMPTVIETIQLSAMVGCFDVDDIILNISGLCIGYGIYKLTVNFISKKRKSVEK